MKKVQIILGLLCLFLLISMSALPNTVSFLIGEIEISISYPQGFVIFYEENDSDSKIFFIADNEETMELRYEEDLSIFEGRFLLGLSVLSSDVEFSYEIEDALEDPSNLDFFGDVYDIEEFICPQLNGQTFKITESEITSRGFFLKSASGSYIVAAIFNFNESDRNLIDDVIRSIRIR